MTEWILPCNIRKYELDNALRNLKKIEWGQSRPITHIAVGDIAYLYEGVPVQAICWKCRVTAVQRFASKIDDSKYSLSNELNMGPLIELEAVYEYTLRQYLSLECLQQHGLTSNLQGPRRIDASSALKKYIQGIDCLQTSYEAQEKDAKTISQSTLENMVKRQIPAPVTSKEVTIAQFYRSPYVAEYAKRRAKGHCQLCGSPAPFNNADGEPYLESHHIEWLSQGGADTIYNTVALCPNCHRKMHIVQAPEDVKLLQSLINIVP